MASMPADNHHPTAAPAAAAPAVTASTNPSSTQPDDNHLSTRYSTLPERISRDFDTPAGSYVPGSTTHDPVSPHAVSVLESSGSPPFRTPSTASAAFNPTHSSVGTHRVSMLEPVGIANIPANGTGNVNRESEGLEVVSPPSQYHQDHGPIPYTENYGPPAEKKSQFQEDHGPIPYVQSYQPDVKHNDGSSYPKGYVAVQQTTDQEGLTDHSFDKFVPPATAKAQKYHGLTKKQWIIVGVVGGIVALAIIIGAVAGALAHKKSSSSSTPASTNSTSAKQLSPYKMLATGGMGASSLESGSDDTRLMYFQTPNGSVAENIYRNGAWSLESATNNSNNALLPIKAGLGAPMSALSYVYNGVATRQIFYIGPAGFVQTVNTTTPIGTYPEKWSEPVQIATWAAFQASTAGIAACAANTSDTLDTLFLFWSDNYNQISQFTFDLTNSSATWVYQASLYGDPNSGLACTFYGGQGISNGVNFYYRNTTTQSFHQYYQEYVNGSWSDWSFALDMNTTTNSGSDVAACNDGLQTEYAFFQDTKGDIARLSGDPASSDGWQVWSDGLLPAAANSRLAAACSRSAATTYLYQNATNASTIWEVGVTRTGTETFNLPVVN